MKKPIKNRFMILGFCLLALLACGKEQDNPTAGGSPSSEGDPVPVIRLEGMDWGYPTPYAHYPRGPGGYKMCLIFDSLLERDEKGLIPWLAEKYEITEGGKVYVFTIRDKVIWQDGRPLTPEDVKFSMEYASLHPATWSYLFGEIESVAVAGREVHVKIREPSAVMPYNIGLTRILPKHIWEKVGNPKTFVEKEAVIGSGPYRLTEYSKTHGAYRLEAFDRFWGPKPMVERIEFIPVSQVIPSFEKGKIDLAVIPPDVLPRIRKDPAVRIIRSPGFWGVRLLFNMESHPVFRKKEVRQAFRYSLDLEGLVRKILRGAGKPGCAGILPEDHVMYNAGAKTYHQDLAKAAELLGNEKMDFDLLCSSEEIRMAEVLKEDLEKAGIRIRILSAAPKTRDIRVREHDYDLAVIGHGGWGRDPDYLRERFGKSAHTKSLSPSASGLAGYENPVLSELLERQHVETDPEKRRALIFQIQEILAEDLPEISLFQTTEYTAYRPKTYDGWMFMFDHHSVVHGKLSFLKR